MNDSPAPSIERRADGLPTIGLAVIAKNEEATLPALLDSIGWTEPEFDPTNANKATLEEIGCIPVDPGQRNLGYQRLGPAVDFVVVCDTGSDDETRELARRRGCRVVDFEWIDDFGAARQASFDALPDGLDFTIWADCDDLIPEAFKLREIASRLPAEVAGTIHRYDYAQDPDGNCICELWRERLVRRGIGESWRLPIHEILDVAGGQMIHVQEVPWLHRQPADRVRDPERNYKILLADLKKSEAAGAPPSTRTLAYLGTEALALGRTEEAVERFEAYLERSDAGWDQERCQVAHKLSIALRMPLEGDEHDPEGLELRLERSQEAAFRAIQERPDWADGYNDLAELALRRDQHARALYFTETAMRLEPPQTLLIINPLEYDYHPRLMRSVALAKMGRAEEAMAETQHLLAVTPAREDLLAQAATLQVDLVAGEAEKHLLALREILVRHDENYKALELLEAAPYFIHDRPAVAAARLDQREMVLHATDPDVYGSYYRHNPNEAPFEQTGIPIDEAHERFHRVKMLREGLLDQLGYQAPNEVAPLSDQEKIDAGGLRILDLSCNDGWMLKNLALAGFGTFGALDGMELNADAAKRAQGRLDPGGTGRSIEEADAQRLPARVVCANLFEAAEWFDVASYDAVVCFETIEHVPDPEALIEQMAAMAKPGVGRIYLSTPDGAYERGNIPDWHRVESKGHLRALRPLDVAALVAPVGRVEQFELAQRLVACSVTNEPRRQRVDLYAGPVEALPEKIADVGLGGSETALCKVAEHFARRGYDARVFAGTEGGLRGDHVSVGSQDHSGGQVLYSPATAWDPGAEADLFISSRVPEAFDRTIKARRRALWLHDADYGDRLTAYRVERATDLIVLSEFQRELLTGHYPFLDEDAGRARLWVSRNGIETSFFEEAVGDRQPWVVYSSSPDRGLDVLLELWPAIVKRVPTAQLHHTYAPVYAQFREAYPHLRAFHERVGQLAAEAPDGSVVAHEHMGQRDLARLFSRSSVWAYPSWTSALADGSSAPFPEISCISAVEAQAGGCVPVALEYGALTESVEAGLLIGAANLDPQKGLVASMDKLPAEWRSDFVDAVVRVLEGDPVLDVEGLRSRGRAFAATRDWSGVVDAWEERLLSEEAATVPA